MNSVQTIESGLCKTIALASRVLHPFVDGANDILFSKADLISCYAKSIGHDAGFYAAWYELMANTAECLEDEKSLLVPAIRVNLNDADKKFLKNLNNKEYRITRKCNIENIPVSF